MSAFEIPEVPRSINGGAIRYDMRQLFPTTAAISGTRPGVSGATTGITTFLWNDSNLYWVPALSYFNLRGHFLDGSGHALDRTSGISYADNWPATLFQQIQIFMNSQSVELLQNPPQADTAILYSTVDRTWLKSFGSAQGVGEALTTRQLNSAQFGTAAVSATNYNEVVATWRPNLSVFDCSYGICPGAQWRVDFSWSNTAEQNLIESIASKIAGTDYTFTLDEFTLYKCTIVPDPTVPIPMKALIEINPVQVNVYQITSGNTGQFNVPLPATGNRMLIGFQDNNSANNLAAGQNGIIPITSFAAAFSSGATDFTSYIQNLYVSFPELGYQAPNPTYNLTAGSAAGAKSDWNRAYGDWVAICRGASGGYEGSVAFGTNDIGIGAAVLRPLETVTPVMTIGDPSNSDQNWSVSAATSAVAATFGNRTAMTGWLGRIPGPIFAFPIIRPPDRLITNANVSVTLSGSVTSIQMFVITSWSGGIAIEKDEMGVDHFTVVRGL
jgi:hypothetical protein